MLIGRQLGPYEIVAKVGEGGMGEVYRARDTRLDRTVAVKVLPPDFAGDPAARERFDREARAISQLSHPNICTLFDVGHEGETAYLILSGPPGVLQSIRITLGDRVQADAPRTLFPLHDLSIQDVAPDGQRFLAIRSPEIDQPREIIVVQNWLDDLKRKVPIP